MSVLRNPVRFVCILLPLAAVSCGKREPAVREHSFLTLEVPVQISDLDSPALVRTSKGALVMTAFLPLAGASATAPYDAIGVHESQDDGATWQEVARVPSYATTGVWGHDLAIDGEDRLYLTWVAGVYDAATRIPLKTVMFARSDDGGRTWTKPVGASDATSGQRRNPALAVSAANLGIAWLDGRPTAEQVAFAASADRGTTWSASVGLEKDLAQKTSGSGEPALCAMPDGGLACAYFSMRKYKESVGGFWVARSSDGGKTFDVDRHGDGPLGQVSLAAAGGRLYLTAVYIADVAIQVPPEPRADVLLYVSDDGGKSWGKPVRVDDDPGRARKSNVLVVPAGGERLLAAWDDYDKGIVLAASLDGGETWGKTVVAAPRSPVGVTPIDLAVDSASETFYLLVGHIRKGAGDAIYLVKGHLSAQGK
jgi:hypothetical protein